MSAVGDNSVNADHLRVFIERVELINIEIEARNEDKSAIYGEAKSSGYDTRAMKEVVKLRAMDRDKRIEHETLVDLYRNAIGLP